MLIIGIDPGITGAICFFENGEVKEVIEMPNMADGKKNKRQINGPQIYNEISKRIINIIRNKICFKNLIITDDLSMKALNNTLQRNVKDSFLAGCNLALHCNGNLREMKIVAKNSPKIDNFILKKTSQLMKIIS